MSKWIETRKELPKDGMIVMVKYLTHNGNIQFARSRYWSGCWAWLPSEVDITHWALLPE